MPAAVRHTNVAQGPQLGPERMEAAHRGPLVSVLARENTHGT